MALPNSNISTTLVGNTIGSGSRDVGTLCTHPNINKWSKWKPVQFDKTEGLTESDLISVACGLSRNPQTQEILYRKPRGGTNNEYYRLGDFRNYNHLAVPPVNVVIVGVKGGPLTGDTIITEPPFILIYGFDYYIDFKLVPGDIDPLWINPQTSRIKNTDSAGGYGGLTWMIGPNLPEQERLPDEVFTCEYFDGPTYTQKITARSGDLRVQYCYYKGSTINKYGTTPHYIEDDGFYNSYRSLFSLRNVSAGISSSTFILSKPLNGNLVVRMNIFNNEAYNLNVKIKLQYERIETGITYNLDTGAFTLNAGYDGNTFVEPLSGWSNGFNSYEIRAWMYIVKPDLTEVEISFQMQTASITISTDG